MKMSKENKYTTTLHIAHVWTEQTLTMNFMKSYYIWFMKTNKHWDFWDIRHKMKFRRQLLSQQFTFIVTLLIQKP